MAEQTRTQRRQLLQEAEGYLELAVCLDDRWPLDDEHRFHLTGRCLETLDKIEDAKGRRALICYLRGQALRISNQFEEAIEALEQSWHLESHNVHTCLALGWCYKRTGRLEEAVEAMQLGLSVQPESAILHYNLACYFAILELPQKAVKHLAQAFKINESLKNLVDDEADFDPIRKNPSFMRLTEHVV